MSDLLVERLVAWSLKSSGGDVAEMSQLLLDSLAEIERLTEQPTYLVGTLVWVPVWQATGIIVDIDDTGKSYGVKFNAPEELPAGTEWFGTESLRLDTSQIAEIQSRLSEVTANLESLNGNVDELVLERDSLSAELEQHQWHLVEDELPEDYPIVVGTKRVEAYDEKTDRSGHTYLASEFRDNYLTWGWTHWRYSTPPETGE